MTRQQQDKDKDRVTELSTGAKALSHGTFLALSCAITCEIVLRGYPHLKTISRANVFLGVMWATVATVFVQHMTFTSTLQSAVSRLVATGISFTLCLAYLLIFPFHVWGLALLIGLGTITTTMVGRPNEVVTAGITTTVVMVVAAMSPEHRWEQPLLRLGDTLIGTAVGAALGWAEGSMIAFYDVRLGRMPMERLTCKPCSSSLSRLADEHTQKGPDAERLGTTRISNCQRD